MKLSIRGLALAMGILWGAAVFLVAIGHATCGGYGKAFLEGVASIGGAYAFVDGLIGGAVLAWLYNLLAGSGKAAV